MLIRPASKVISICLKPSPSWPSMFRAGTRQSSRDSADVTEPLRPILGSFLPGTKPGMPFSTRKQVMPRVPASGSVLAVQMTTSAMAPDVIHILLPLSTKSSPSRTATVRVAPASEPASGSVSPKAPRPWPLHRRGNHLRFCSWAPKA